MSTPTTLRIDDVDSNVFTSGIWQTPRGDVMLYKGSGSISYVAGSSKVVRFRGTSIAVIGRVMRNNVTAPPPSNQEAVMRFSVDGAPQTHAPNPDPTYYDITVYFEYYRTDQLPFGEHVLSIYNMAFEAYVVLDEFVIQAEGGTPQILRSNGSPFPSKTAGPPIPVSASSKDLPGSTASSSVFSASIYNPTTINASDLTTQGNIKSSNRTTVIIAVLASLFFVLFVLGIMIFLLRRRRKAKSLPVDPYPSNSTGVAQTQVLSPTKLSAGSSDSALTGMFTASSPFFRRYEKQGIRAPNEIQPPPYVA